MRLWLKQKNPDKRKRHWILWTLLLFVLIASAVVGAGYWYMFVYTGDLTNGDCEWLIFKCTGEPIDLDKPSHEKLKQVSYVRDKDSRIISMFFYEVRDPIKLKEVPQLLINGFVAAEDKRFYRGLLGGRIDHPGVDPFAILRAFIGNTAPAFTRNYLNLTKLSGASGIASQYTRLRYAYDVPEFRTRAQSYKRKLKEAKIAIQLTKKYSRDKIMEDFLNLIFLGHGVNGVAAAAQRYFGKDIRHEQLTLREVAVIVSLNKSHIRYDPVFHKPAEPVFNGRETPEEIAKIKEDYSRKSTKEILRLANARTRCNWILGRMLEDGYITKKDYDGAIFKDDEPLERAPSDVKPLRNKDFNYGTRLVKEFLLNQGFSESELSYYGGFQIYTTFDPKIQKIVTEEFENHLSYINQEKASADRLNGAFIVIETKTGNILATSGGYNFNESQYNRVMASRSPGSGIKPFVYATAMEKFGYDFFTKACNTSLRMPGAKGKIWAPENFKEKNPRPMDCNRDMAEGIIFSLNLETLNIALKITMSPIIDLMNDFGVWGNPGIVRDSRGSIWFRMPYYEIKGGLVPLLPTAIGASETNLIELAGAYATFFREGIYIRPTIIRELKDSSGKHIAKIEPSYQEQVLSRETSNKIVAMMRAVTKVGTAKISMRNIEQQVACKTGTSDGPRDVSMWCGTPDLVIAVRIGHDDYRVIELPEYMKKVSGDVEMQVSGGWVVGPLVRKIVDRIYSERMKTEFSPEVESGLQTLLERYQN